MIHPKAELNAFQVLSHIEGKFSTSPSWSMSPKQRVVYHDNVPVGSSPTTWL